MHNNKLNIVYHFRVRGTGAEGVHIAGIVNSLRADGHKVHLISPTNVDPTIQSTEPLKEKKPRSVKSILLHKLADLLPQPFFELMEILYNLFAVCKLYKATSSRKVDFIYERYAFFNLAGAVISRLKHIPLVLEVNELSGYERVRTQVFVKICSTIEKIVLRQSVIVISVSDFLNNEITGKIDKEKTQVVTIPNGVPEKWLKRTCNNDTLDSLRNKYNLQSRKIICFVGSLVHWHNFDLLLNAVKDVQKEIPDAAIIFLGEGPFKDYIIEKSAKLGMKKDSVLLLGYIPHSDIPDYLFLSDITVIPETNDYRSPIKMFEYMAMAKIVVAPRKPAIESVISHSEDGLLFEPGDPVSLSQMLIQGLSDTKITNNLGQNARDKILKEYTWEIHAKEILGLFFSSYDSNI